MLFISINDFYEKTKNISTLKREEEIYYASQFVEGNISEGENLVNAYLPYVAMHILHLPKEFQTLELVYRCYQMLECEVKTFDFLQDRESFSHRLSNCLRQTVTRYIAER